MLQVRTVSALSLDTNTAKMKPDVYTFICPVCAKIFRSQEPGEPCCTGPNESLDEHELTVMHLQTVDGIKFNPFHAWQRAQGPLILK